MFVQGLDMGEHSQPEKNITAAMPVNCLAVDGNQRDDTEQWQLSPAPALSAVNVLCYLIDWVSVGVICHPCPPDQRVFCPAGVPHHQLPTEQAT